MYPTPRSTHALITPLGVLTFPWKGPAVWTTKSNPSPLASACTRVCAMDLSSSRSTVANGTESKVLDRSGKSCFHRFLDSWKDSILVPPTVTFALCLVSWQTTLPPTLPDPPTTRTRLFARFSNDIFPEGDLSDDDEVDADADANSLCVDRLWDLEGAEWCEIDGRVVWKEEDAGRLL